MLKKQDNPVSYRPSKKVKGLFEEYCSGKAMLTKSQLIDVAIEFLMMRPTSEVDTIIWKFLKGEFDDDTLARLGEMTKKRS